MKWTGFRFKANLNSTLLQTYAELRTLHFDRLYNAVMVLCALAASLAFARPHDPLDAKVTFTCPGLAVPKLVEQLSRESHVSLFAPKAFWNDIIAIRAKDAPLKDLLGKIGELAAGDWVEKDGRLELVRSAARIREQEHKEFRFQVGLFQRALDQGPEADLGSRTLERRCRSLGCDGAEGAGA